LRCGTKKLDHRFARLTFVSHRPTTNGPTDNSLARVSWGRIHHRYDGEGTGKVVTDLDGFCCAASLVEPSYRISMYWISAQTLPLLPATSSSWYWQSWLLFFGGGLPVLRSTHGCLKI
jgi:hypothetical protein